MRTIAALLALLPVLVTACGGGTTYSSSAVEVRPVFRPVSILVEVYDPVTNYVFENVAVRIVEADQEWSQCTCSSPYFDWYLTDSAGQAYLDEWALGYSQVGFIEDAYGNAIIGSRSYEDQALVVLEIDADGFFPFYVEVDLSFDWPDVYVQVPLY
ncbi:hypothetical protein LBMAG49_20630 [Planctomycetota bacterium]|jgi:hypothetical protein|nr:hypothetical protein [Planctomycetota bacterium]GDY02734.1 hypothetical protein LBMAG49_20630 [Planctomycetota bacterium]